MEEILRTFASLEAVIESSLLLRPSLIVSRREVRRRLDLDGRLSLLITPEKEDLGFLEEALEQVDTFLIAKGTMVCLATMVQ